MANLKDEHKAFIVKAWATARPAPEIAEMFRDRFGFAVDLTQVRYYNPTYKNDLSAKWHELYATTRHEFLTGIEEQPGASMAFRVSRLTEMSEAARRKGNFPLAASLLEQIAKETNGVYGRGGDAPAPMPAPPAVVVNNTVQAAVGVSDGAAAIAAKIAAMTTEEKRALLAQKMGVEPHELPEPTRK